MSIYELITRLKGSRKFRLGYIWCTDGDFVSPSEFKRSNKTAYGYALSEGTVVSLKRSTSKYVWYDAESYCIECINGGKYGYFPDRYWLRSLYSSIMYGRMESDLMTAGIYKMCNYRMLGRRPTEPYWYCIWSRDEYDPTKAYVVSYEGIYDAYMSNCYYVIPFFKF